MWHFPVSLLLRLGCVPAILMPEDITALMLHKDNMEAWEHWLVSFFEFLIQKAMGSGSWWFVIYLLLWRETSTSQSLLPRHQGKIYGKERRKEKKE